MSHTKMIAAIAVGLVFLLLSACSSAVTPTSAPTVDLNAHSTQVASTVLAQVTHDLALTPSITPVPSATATLEPSATPAVTTTSSPVPLGSGTPGITTTDQAEWVSQSVADGTVLAPGETFTITWTLRNVGSSTWTTFYLLRYYSGNTFGASKEIFLDKEVFPSQTVDISIEMKAPTTVGEYRTDWVMANELRSNFKEPVFLEITVAKPATPTPTATATPTATRTPTVTATP